MEEHNGPARNAQRYVVARASELPEGERLIVDVAGREIGIFNIDGELYAIRNRCPHLGGPLCKGEVLGLVYSSEPGDVRFDASRKLLTCPWHGWEFDIKTGQSYFNPRLRARRYDVESQQGDDVGNDIRDAMRAAEHDVEARQGSDVGDNQDDTAERTPGPYKAEMVPVSEEDDYIVITMTP